MKRIIGLVFLAMAAASATAQLSNQDVIYVSSAPSGACIAAPPIEVVASTGTAYTCNNGTWAAISGGGGGAPTGPAGGDLGGTYPNPSVVALNGTNLAGLATGFLFNTTATGVPSSIGSTGTGNVVLATSPTLVTPALGTPSSVVLTSASGLPISTGLTGAGTGVLTALAAAVTGSGGMVLATSPSIATPTVTGSFTATGLVTLADMATQAANTVLVNATSGAASPTAQSVASCSGATNALNWTTNTGFGCNSSITANSATTAVNLSGGGTVTGTPAASVAAIQTNPTLFTGGSGTTTFPYLMLQPSGATAETAWSTAGTFLGINSASGFTGNFIDAHLNNATAVFTVNSSGSITGRSLLSTLNDWRIQDTNPQFGSTTFLSWSSTAAFSGTNDVGIDRSTTNVLEVNTGTAQGSGGSIKANGIIGGSYQQIAASNSGGTCAMSTSTSCTITIGHTYTTPVCIATQQSSTLTGASVGCTVSGTTVTVTAAVANSETWGAFVFGNPN